MCTAPHRGPPPWQYIFTSTPPAAHVHEHTLATRAQCHIDSSHRNVVNVRAPEPRSERFHSQCHPVISSIYDVAVCNISRCGCVLYVRAYTCAHSPRDEGWKVDCYSVDGGWRGRQGRPEKLVYCCHIIAPHINVRISFECCFISLICATLRPFDRSHNIPRPPPARRRIHVAAHSRTCVIRTYVRSD